MDKALYIASGAANVTLMAQAVHSNNLANVNTTGFKSDLAYFIDKPVEGGGFPTRVYTTEEQPRTDFSPGSIVTTGNSLDVAVQGDGFMAVQANNGEEAYTRAGALTIAPSGLLVDRSGRPVMGNAGAITVPQFESLEIGSDGTLSIRPVGQDATSKVVIDRIKLVKADTSLLQKRDDGLFGQVNGQALSADASIRITSGAVEQSNVNPVEEMTSIIELARQFELQLKMVSTIEENDQKTSTLLRLNG